MSYWVSTGNAEMRTGTREFCKVRFVSLGKKTSEFV